MKWRYAVTKFDTTKKLTSEQIDEIMEAAILTPSAFGLQPWRFIVVTNPEIRKQLQEAGYNQPKISEASHLVVLAVEKNIDDKLVDAFIDLVSKVRGMDVGSLKGYSDMIKGSLVGKSTEQRIEWATKQVYIALGVIITTASSMEIDSAPMEGFDPKKFDEILGLEKMGLESKVAVALGFRSADDASAGYAKVRYPKEKVILEVK